ncbi:MAG: Gfo/Idh/MocA family oxidoreductase [Acidimicrobiales bacterium]
MSPLRVGVAGLGRMGRRHLRVLSELDGVEVAWTLDPAGAPPEIGEARRPGASPVRSVPNFLSIDDVIDQHVNAVVVATPTFTHAAVARSLLAPGRTLLVEKPLAATTAEATELVALAGRVGATLAVGHVERFNPAVLAVRELLAAGRLGRPLSLAFRRVGLRPIAVPDVDVLADLGVHDLDICALLCPDEISVVGAVTWPAEGLAESAQILCRAGDVGAQLQVNWRTPTRIREFTLTTEECLVEVNYTTQVVEIAEPIALQHFERFSGFQSHYAVARRTRLEVPTSEPLLGQAMAFVSLARDGIPSLLASGDDGLRAVRLAEQARNLAATDRGTRR